MAPMETNVSMRVIGVVRTSHTGLETTPIQAALNRAEHATIEISDAYADGLDGLAEFDYAWLLTWLHAPDRPAGPVPLRQVPFLLRARPRRVNPIGLSLIQILQVAGPVIRFAGVDLLDGTPVVDVKPYVTRFDAPPVRPRCGWFDQVPIEDGATPARLARGGKPPGEDGQ